MDVLCPIHEPKQTKKTEPYQSKNLYDILLSQGFEGRKLVRVFALNDIDALAYAFFFIWAGIQLI